MATYEIPAESAATHLWEVDHPYHSAEGNYFSNNYTTPYPSWQSFVSAEGDNDFDWNLLFRWDWTSHEYIEHDGLAARQEYASRFGDRDHAWTLSLFWILQRKGIYRVTPVEVCKADEPEVREWLLPRLRHLQLLWTPLVGVDRIEMTGSGS